jgi:hypothetical protein
MMHVDRDGQAGQCLRVEGCLFGKFAAKPTDGQLIVGFAIGARSMPVDYSGMCNGDCAATATTTNSDQAGLIAALGAPSILEKERNDNAN